MIPVGFARSAFLPQVHQVQRMATPTAVVNHKPKHDVYFGIQKQPSRRTLTLAAVIAALGLAIPAASAPSSQGLQQPTQSPPSVALQSQTHQECIEVDYGPSPASLGQIQRISGVHGPDHYRITLSSDGKNPVLYYLSTSDASPASQKLLSNTKIQEAANQAIPAWQSTPGSENYFPYISIKPLFLEKGNKAFTLEPVSSKKGEVKEYLNWDFSLNKLQKFSYQTVAMPIQLSNGSTFLMTIYPGFMTCADWQTV